MKRSQKPIFKKCSSDKKVLIRQKKVLKRQFEKCSNNNFYKTLCFNRKSFCNILGAEWHLLPLEKTKIMNSSLYEQKNHFLTLFLWLMTVTFPVIAQQKTETTYTFRFVPKKDMFYVPWNGNDTELARCWNVSKTTKQQFLTANCRYWLTATVIHWAMKPRTLPQRRFVQPCEIRTDYTSENQGRKLHYPQSCDRG